jgi:lysophospholipase L1-like esterase
MEAWLKTTASSIQVAVSMGTGFTSNAWMGINGSGHFVASVYGTGAFSNGALLDSGIAINDGNWHHCVMQMSGGTTLATYVDGAVAASSSGTIAAITTSGAIGRFLVVAGYPWSGSIDEVAFWNVAKYSGRFSPPTSPYVGTEANLQALYHLQADGSNSGPTGGQGAPTVVAPNSAAILYSPYNWVVTGTSATTINSGAYFRTIFSGTSAALLTNTVNNEAPYSELWARVDGDAWQELTLSSGSPILPVASGLQSRNHLLEVIVKSTSETIPRWGPNSATMVTITGIQLDLGSTAEAPLSRTKHILIYGDSITEGVRTVNATAINDTDRNDVLSDYAYALANAVDAEVGIVAFGETGVTVGGSGGAPALPSSYNFVYSGAPRTFSPAPDLVIYNEGTNDSGSITPGLETVVDGIIAHAPNSKHLILVPFNQTHISDIQSTVTAIGSANVSYQGTSGWFNTADSSDGMHPYGYSHLGFIAPQLFPAVEHLLYAGTGP